LPITQVDLPEADAAVVVDGEVALLEVVFDDEPQALTTTAAARQLNSSGIRHFLLNKCFTVPSL
jgi:hypothetical protein